MSTRSPISQGLNGAVGQERPNGDATQSEMQPREELQSSPRGLQPTQESRNTFGVDAGSNGGQGKEQSLESIFSGMSERDKWTMPGFLALYEGPNPVYRGLTRGQDLSTLGLDMSSEAPLLDTYTGPFGSVNSRPLRPLDSQFTIPECYTVNKVSPVRSRINGFTDETLFYIFYTSPRDMIQEDAASELRARKWSYHMKEKMWFVKDDSSQSQWVLPGKVEFGYFIWWDWRNWRKMKRQYEMRWEDVEPGWDMPIAARGQLNDAITPGINGGSAFNIASGLERVVAQGRGF